MNNITLRHHAVTLAYRTSPFHTKRHELGKQIRLFLNRRRFRQHVRTLLVGRLTA
ncbi:MAG: hypothetical protein AAB839_03170 [Patescibacteria group bacterium]